MLYSCFFQVQIFTTFSDPVSFVRDSFGSGPEYDASIQNVIEIQRCLYQAYQETGHNGKNNSSCISLKDFLFLDFLSEPCNTVSFISKTYYQYLQKEINDKKNPKNALEEFPTLYQVCLLFCCMHI